ncbi:MAG: chemotaxis response regulator protein-glutamate methylesterase [Spirochaetaceae bacterium]
MDTGNVSVIVCDDSALMRNLVGKMVENAEGLTLAGKAMNGRFLLQKIPKLDPDVIVLDLEMPEMSGIEFLKERKERGIEVPVVILSSVAERGAKITMEALSLGASDFILKPSGSISEDIHKVEKNLVEMLWGYGLEYRRSRGIATPSKEERTKRRGDGSVPETEGRSKAPGDSASAGTETAGTASAETGGAAEPAAEPARIRKRETAEIKTAVSPVSRAEAGALEIVVIGISTGGPNALRAMCVDLSPDFPLPIVVVQHMPAGFTTEFAKSLDRICPLEVKEAADGDLLKPGRMLICPGNYHIEVERRRLAGVAKLSQGDLVNGHRPSADVLFASAAQHYGGRVLAAIMTGMGKDGARELGSIHRNGGITIAQDKASSIVYGMPKVAAELGHVQQIVPLSKMAETLNSLAMEHVTVK